MSNVIDSVRRQAVDILTSIKRLNPDTAFAVGTFTDYGGPTPWILHQDFTQDLNLTRDRLGAVSLRHNFNVDSPEAYSRALAEAVGLSWRPRARRYILLFGDAPAHDPDAGRDGISGTTDDLRFIDVVQKLRAEHITALVIFDASKVRPASSAPARVTDDALAGFEYLAEETGGIARPMTGADDVAKAAQGALRQSLRFEPVLRAVPEWTHWTLISEPTVLDDGSFAYNVRVKAPASYANGVYRFPLVAAYRTVAGDVEIGSVGLTVRLGGGAFNWRLLLIPLGILGLVLLVLVKPSRMGNRGGCPPYQGHWSIVRFGARLVAVLAAGAVLYFLWFLSFGAAV